jgi:Sec-independent protein translocase protein TatA
MAHYVRRELLRTSRLAALAFGSAIKEPRWAMSTTNGSGIRDRFSITLFKDVAARAITVKELTLYELRDLIFATSAASKAELPLLKLAKFGSHRTANGSLRHNQNVIEINGIEGDYDEKQVTLAQAVAALDAAHLKAIAYTSPSHSTAEPKWRCLLFTSRPLPPEERIKLVARVNGVLGGILASESFTLSQGFYLGSVNSNPDHCVVLLDEGDYIDLRDDLDANARGKSTGTQGGDNQAQPNQKSDKQADPDLIYAAMAVIPNETRGWVAEYNPTGMAIFNATNGVERGFEAFDMWARKSPIYNSDNVRERWQRYFASPPTEIGAGTIFQRADQAQRGWRALVGLPIDKITVILRLAKLARAQYDIERKEAAKTLSVRMSTLDEIVARMRDYNGPDFDDQDQGQGTRIEFLKFEPWPDSVAGIALVTDMKRTICSHVILSDDQALAVSLWTIHTHAVEVAEHSPRLQIKSPTKRCGKSTLLNVISPMVLDVLKFENITPASVFRLIEKYRPTLLIDEADSFLKRDDGRDYAEMSGLLNAGHARGGTVIRTVGEDFEPRAFHVYGPIAYAWLVKRGMHVSETLEDRSITIELRRRLPEEAITRLRSTRTGHLHELGRRVARWVGDHKTALADADPEMPEELNDRAQDNWRPLIAIADAMSADLGQKTRDAAKRIEAETIGGGEEDASIIALADVAAIVRNKIQNQSPNAVRLKAIASSELVTLLVAMAERPWSEWRRGQPLTQNSLARLLKPYGLKPKRHRIGTGPNDTIRGYATDKILEAEQRFVDVETEEGDAEDAEQDAQNPPF